MTSKEIIEVIQEALLMYIDDISIINSVRKLPNRDRLYNKRLEVKLRDGEKFQLLVTKNHYIKRNSNKQQN